MSKSRQRSLCESIMRSELSILHFHNGFKYYAGGNMTTSEIDSPFMKVSSGHMEQVITCIGINSSTTKVYCV